MTEGRVYRGLREMGRGLEGEVELGEPGVSVRLAVILSPIDPEWQALRAQIEQLMVTRASAAVSRLMGSPVPERVSA